MSARDDYPNPGHYAVHNKMCDEIDWLREEVAKQINFNQRLMKELAQHGWGDFHYGSTGQDRNIVALLEEGGYQYDRASVTKGWDYNEYTVRGEPESLIDRTTRVDPRSIIQSPTDASPTGGDREPGQREDSVGRSRRREIFDGLGILHEEGGTG